MEAGNNESGVTLRPDLWTSPVLDNLRGATSSSNNCGVWNHEKFSRIQCPYPHEIEDFRQLQIFLYFYTMSRISVRQK
jgi:hypothetical protein